jgi:uncharacterized protein (DUF433 family)
MATVPEVKADPLPLVNDRAGGYRIGNTRVSLELVLEAFDAGLSPEQIVSDYDVLDLADVYALKSHWLRHPDWAREYLQWAKEAAEQSTQRIASLPTSQDGFKARLLAKRTLERE